MEQDGDDTGNTKTLILDNGDNAFYIKPGVNTQVKLTRDTKRDVSDEQDIEYQTENEEKGHKG